MEGPDFFHERQGQFLNIFLRPSGYEVCPLGEPVYDDPYLRIPVGLWEPQNDVHGYCRACPHRND